MKRILPTALLSVIGLWPPAVAQQQYEPPEVKSAGDAHIPYQFMADGFFVLDVYLDRDGRILRIDPLRDPGAMLGAAKNSVGSWTFRAAFRDGHLTASRITAIFVYRPANYGTAGAVPPKNFVPVIPPDSSADGPNDYVPVGVLSFAYPDYPVNSVAWGSVVVQVTVDSSGRITYIDFLHRMNGFDNLAVDALKTWRFRSAKLGGKPVLSRVVIAFVFQPPSTS
jgi:TonB family protein